MKLNIFPLILITLLSLSCNKDSGGGTSSASVSAAPSPLETSESTSTANTNETEQEGILFMWEEEKLARDVYTQMFKKYGSSVFSNISKSEQQHMDAVKTLLDRAGLTTPTDEKQVGVFKNTELAKLYKELIQRGNNSLYDAYRVGLDIELMDIEDLTQRIEMTNDPAIKKVYSNLLEGSYNHKASFEKKL